MKSAAALSLPVADGLAETQEESTIVSKEDTYEYAVRELCTQRDGKRIYGVIHIPQSARKKMPAVIFCHGFGGSHQGAEKYAQVLAEKGYVCFRFDFCGGSLDSRSDGSVCEMSLFTEQTDLEAVISMIQGLRYVDSENLFLIGASQGGVVAAVTAAVHRAEIRGMVLIYPSFVMVDDAKRLFEDAGEIPDTCSFMGMDVGRSYFGALLDLDIYKAIAAYDREVLLIHGDADGTAPLAYSRRAALEAYPLAELKVLPGAGHGFSGGDVRQAADWILEYLQNHRVSSQKAGKNKSRK